CKMLSALKCVVKYKRGRPWENFDKAFLQATAEESCAFCSWISDANCRGYLSNVLVRAFSKTKVLHSVFSWGAWCCLPDEPLWRFMTSHGH
uniref:Uncharacterized protein n=1 Tax=Zonotrichia albicollis TaxID=44394 RepID=A0A8D2MNT4_ZONAL